MMPRENSSQQAAWSIIGMKRLSHPMYQKRPLVQSAHDVEFLQPALSLLLSIFLETPLHSLLQSTRSRHLEAGQGGENLLELVINFLRF